MEAIVKYINVYLNRKGLCSASLCKDAEELANIGGSYPNARSAKLDGQRKWGRGFDVKKSYSPMFASKEVKDQVIKLLSEGEDSEVVAAKFKLKLPWVRAIKAHVTMGTYNEIMKML